MTSIAYRARSPIQSPFFIDPITSENCWVRPCLKLQVKRLYDAFHEPFRKVLPVGNPAQPNAAQSAGTASSSREQAALPAQMPMDEVQGSDDSEAEE